MASATEGRMASTLVSPVIWKRRRMRGARITSVSDPPASRSRLSPPTRAPRPVESRKPTWPRSAMRWSTSGPPAIDGAGQRGRAAVLEGQVPGHVVADGLHPAVPGGEPAEPGPGLVAEHITGRYS